MFKFKRNLKEKTEKKAAEVLPQQPSDVSFKAIDKWVVPDTGTDYLVHSVAIGKKDVLKYIKGKCSALFGSDYYSSYYYINGILYLAAFSSPVYISGKLSVFTIALIEKGKYYYKEKGSKLYKAIENTGESIVFTIAIDEPVGYQNVVDIPQISENKIPKTIYLKWSNDKNNKGYGLLLIVFFVLSVVFFGYTSLQYRQISQMAGEEVKSKKVKHAKKSVVVNINANIALKIGEMGSEIRGKGIIRKVLIAKNDVVFYIAFKAESDTQLFITKHGGRIEGDQVVYIASLDGNNRGRTAA